MRSLAGVFLILFGLVFIQTGCAPDAPHDNPLDPRSPNYRDAGNLSGSVLTLSFPYKGISGALVTIQENGLSKSTSSDGSFSFVDAPAGNITLIVSKASYLSDTLHITVPVGGTYNATVHLDALPVITNSKVVTTKIDQWWPGPVYSATVTANVTDPDGIGDVVDSTVCVRIDSLSFRMNYTGGSGNFGVTISDSSLPGQDLQWLVGKEFIVSAADRESGTSFSQPFYVSRIIEAQESEPAPTQPLNSDSTSPNPTFEWNPPSVSYSYTYFLQIYQINAGTQTQVGGTISLGESYVSYAYPGSLEKGTYIWTIGIVDQYGNSCRSKEAAFVVP